jgi:hypothetical protein
MQTSYAVTWQDAEEKARSGNLRLRPEGMTFDGCEPVPYEEIAKVRIGRSAADRLSDRQTLVVERRSGARILIAGLVLPGIVSELAERLGSLSGLA